MTISKRLLVRGLAGAAMSLAVVTGCQTYTGGMTLSSPHYLKHYPQYFAPDPVFPLQRERDSQLDPTGEIRRGAPQGALPDAVPIPGQLQQPGPAVGTGGGVGR